MAQYWDFYVFIFGVNTITKEFPKFQNFFFGVMGQSNRLIAKDNFELRRHCPN